MSASGSSALEIIRAKTADAHQALERTLHVARSDAGEEAYGRYLRALLGWLEPLEASLWSGAWPAQIDVACRTAKVGWIVADLRARGLRDREIAAIPRQNRLASLATLEQRFGIAYVVEGAQLGGQVLLRRIGPRVAPLPTRFLEGYGRECGPNWRSFIAALGASVTDREHARAAAESARAAFETAHAWFALQGAA
jgi:heme oxygenase (biliverdin-IX-beta and delta-forming)